MAHYMAGLMVGMIGGYLIFFDSPEHHLSVICPPDEFQGEDLNFSWSLTFETQSELEEYVNTHGIYERLCGE